MKRVFVIGLDGATFDLINPFIAEGYLPNLAQLIQSGSSGQLLSTNLPMSAPAWASFMTGMNQAKHGIYDFIQRRSGEYNLEVTNASHIKAPTIFEICSQMGKRVISINVPYTLPSPNFNGVMIGGPFTPAFSKSIVKPSGYYDELIKVVPNYKVLPDYNPLHPDPLLDYAGQLMDEIDTREKVCLHLLQKEQWDLFTVVFMSTDEVQHSFWRYLKEDSENKFSKYHHVIRGIYHRADQAIGTFIRAINSDGHNKDTVVIVLSDHGAGPHEWMININRYLYEQGYLVFKQDISGYLKKLQSIFISTLVNSYRKYAAPRVRAAIRKWLGVNIFEKIKSDIETALLTAGVDWDHTRAYALGAGGHVYLNLKGREPNGIIEPGSEYMEECEKLIEVLKRMVVPETGQRVISEVYRREELYNGPYIEQAPDLIINWVDYSCWGRGRFEVRAPIFERMDHFDLNHLPLSSNHRPEGIFIMNGPGVLPGIHINNARIIDVAPTILSQLNIQSPFEMDGDILLNALTQAEIERIGSLQTQTSTQAGLINYEYSPEEAEIISRHLESLGYF